MKCQACGSEIAEESRFCPECGAPLSDALTQGPGSAPVDARIQPILAEANLLRMRGRWEEAIGKCVEAMRIYPNNATAHALIGDIYAEQRRDADALQWYQMAVELDPDNPHDRAKVEALLAKLEASSPEPVSREELLRSLPGVSSEVPRGGPWVLWAIAIVAVAVLLVVAVIKYLPGGRRAAAPVPTGIAVEEAPVAEQPSEVAGPPPAADVQRGEGSTAGTGPLKMTFEETNLLTTLSTVASSARDKRYDPHSVTIDLTQNTCEVSVTAALQDAGDPEARARSVALEVARDVFAAKSGLAGVAVRVFGDYPTPSTGGYGKLAFIGYVRLGAQNRFERSWASPVLKDLTSLGGG